MQNQDYINTKPQQVINKSNKVDEGPVMTIFIVILLVVFTMAAGTTWLIDNGVM